MIQFLKKLFLVIIPVFLALITVNYFGDAANLFSKDYEKKIAYEINKGNNVTNVYNCNERLLQKYIINNSLACPELLVVGSSRIMLINSNYFKGKTFFNNGVSGGTLEDIISIIQLYRDKGCLPKEIIIGLDPWTLNANNGQTQWKTLETNYRRFFNLKPIDTFPKNQNLITKAKDFYISNIKYRELLSPSYFKSSFLRLISGHTKPYVSNKKDNKFFTKLSDGSIIYDEELRNSSIDKIDELVAKFVESDIYRVENFHRLDKLSQSKLVFLIDFLISNNIKVNLFICPYHPKVYEIIVKNNKYKKVIESERFFKKLAFEKGLMITGSFDPAKLNMDKSYFYDGMHLKNPGIEILINSLKK